MTGLSQASVVAAVIIVLSALSAHASLTPAQVTMLQLFYNSTGGPQWTHQSGWNTPVSNWSDPCDPTHPHPVLYGVTCGAGVVRVFNLEANGLSGTIPADFFLTFPTITTIQLLNNPQLGGQLPEIPFASPATNILMSSCAFTGPIPASYFTFSLNQLQLQLNQLTGGLPVDVGNCTELQLLNIGENSLQIGAIPDAITNCHALQTLSVINSGVTSVPSNLGASLGQLSVLNLQGNSISGTIPTDWCSMTMLTALYLQDNHQLSGELPSCMVAWGGLQYLIIENTAMTGTIPTFMFTAFSNLLGLYLSGSKFSGTIPDMFDQKLSQLEHAEFNGNNVAGDPVYSGPFPSTLLGLRFLQTLSIQYTQIEGPTRGFSQMESLTVLTLSSNPKMTMTFPDEIITQLWASPTTFPGATRGIILENMPVTGTLPNALMPVYDLSTTGGVGFTQTQITGYIPNSTLSWVPQASQRNMFANCHQLLYPVKSWMQELTGNFNGLQFVLNSAFGGVSLFPMSGGSTLGIYGQNYVNISGRFHCGFCISGDTAACQDDVNAMTDAVRNANLAFSPAALQNVPGGSAMFCETPAVASNNMSIPVYIFYVGPAYGDGIEYYQVSSNYITINFYNPSPTVQHLLPDHGRLEGCTTLYAVGSGFLNAPNASLVISGTIWALNGQVVNDSFVKFVLPSANTSAVNQKYNFAENVHLAVSLFPNGDDLSMEATSFATYQFTSTCPTPLVPCVNGFTDDEGCPTPLCRCFSVGLCHIPNGSTSFSCTCHGGYAGAGCEACQTNYFGPQCSRCTCDHGTCRDGIDADGSCECDSAYFGGTCAISKWGLGLGVPIAVLAVSLTAFLVRRRMLRRGTCDDDNRYSKPLNAVGDK